jgi:AAA-like domain
LQEQPELAGALHAVMSTTEPVELEPIVAYKLRSMGLIEQSGNKAMPGCELYRQSYLKE